MLSPAEALRILQRNIAQRSIGPSTVRGAGRAGVCDCAREYFGGLDLRDFSVSNEKAFRRALDRHTDLLLAALPRSARSWGLARKCLNIFLRDVVDHHRTRERYRLARVEPWLEIPLDRHVALGIAATPPGEILPRWTTITALRPEVSELYQRAAAAHARALGVTRVFLDAVMWRADGL